MLNEILCGAMALGISMFGIQEPSGRVYSIDLPQNKVTWNYFKNNDRVAKGYVTTSYKAQKFINDEKRYSFVVISGVTTCTPGDDNPYDSYGDKWLTNFFDFTVEFLDAENKSIFLYGCPLITDISEYIITSTSGIKIGIANQDEISVSLEDGFYIGNSTSITSDIKYDQTVTHTETEPSTSYRQTPEEDSSGITSTYKYDWSRDECKKSFNFNYVLMAEIPYVVNDTSSYCGLTLQLASHANFHKDWFSGNATTSDTSTLIRFSI